MLLSQCSSHYYSTSIVLPPSKIEKGDLDLNLGIEVMPEADSEPDHSFGGSLSATFGLDELRGLNTRLFMSDTNLGISATLLKGTALTDDSRIYSCPRFGFTYDIFGLGVGLGYELIYQKSFYNSSFYSGIGVAYGTEIIDFSSDQFGIAFISNLGYSTIYSPNLRVSFELNPIVQIYEGSLYPVINSSISVGYFLLGKDRKKFNRLVE